MEMTNQAKINALKSILDQMNRCANAFEFYERSSDDMRVTYENIWSSEEDKARGMRKMYKAMFGESVPYTRNEIEAMISQSR